MWVARERVTRSGFLLGDHERVSPYAALEAVTLGPALLLQKDHVLGTIEVGKWADLTILSDDPVSTSGDELRSIDVLATVVGGHVSATA